MGGGGGGGRNREVNNIRQKKGKKKKECSGDYPGSGRNLSFHDPSTTVTSFSLPSKRFLGVFCTEKLISVFWMRAKWGEKKKGERGDMEETSSPLSSPLFVFFALVPISARSNSENAQTEALATQAIPLSALRV